MSSSLTALIGGTIESIHAAYGEPARKAQWVEIYRREGHLLVLGYSLAAQEDGSMTLAVRSAAFFDENRKCLLHENVEPLTAQECATIVPGRHIDDTELRYDALLSHGGSLIVTQFYLSESAEIYRIALRGGEIWQMEIIDPAKTEEA